MPDRIHHPRPELYIVVRNKELCAKPKSKKPTNAEAELALAIKRMDRMLGIFDRLAAQTVNLADLCRDLVASERAARERIAAPYGKLHGILDRMKAEAQAHQRRQQQ